MPLSQRVARISTKKDVTTGGGTEANDSDVDPTTGQSGNYTIDPLDPTKKDILTVDAALYSPKGSLGDFVWKDTNNNGIQDETTANGGGVAGVQVELYKVGTTTAIAKDTTDATGIEYLFSNLDGALVNTTSGGGGERQCRGGGGGGGGGARRAPTVYAALYITEGQVWEISYGKTPTTMVFKTKPRLTVGEWRGLG